MRTKKIRLEIITLGDELLLGLRENSHLTYLGRQFAQYGLTIRRNLVIRDEEEEIERFFKESWATSDVVITTGGLGPTVDDITRETLARVLSLELVHNASVEESIRKRFKRMGRTVTENNLRQAKVFRGAEILPNFFGTAPGIWLKRDKKYLIMLPGPPSELYPMFENQVLPRMRRAELIEKREGFLQLRTCGIGESLLETRLALIFKDYDGKLGVAYCAHSGVVDVRLSPAGPAALSWETLEAIAAKCSNLLGDDFVGCGDCSLARLILGQLRSLRKTLAVAESCTGGLLSNAFTDIPGASKVFAGGVVCYNNDAKVEMLGVPDIILRQHGAVSAECAVALATGVSEKLSADYALSITGFAGPGGGTRESPVGTIFLGYHSPVGSWSRKVVYPGNRLAVKARAVTAALDWMRRKLKKYEVEHFLDSLSS